jgi:hypothetical protein
VTPPCQGGTTGLTFHHLAQFLPEQARTGQNRPKGTGMKTKNFSLNDKLTFGKYKGYTIEEVLESDPNYIEWAIDEIEWFELDEMAAKKFNDVQGYNDFMNDW